MNHKLKPFLAFFLITLLLSGCSYQGAYLQQQYGRTERFGGTPYISLRDFCNVHGFLYSVDEISRIAKITDAGTTVKIMPDSNISLINDSVKRFSPQAKFKNDTIYIPPSLARFLERDVFKKEPVPYLERITIRKIVIDPGHGGRKDIGAVGRSYKLKEKDVVLDIAKRLKEELSKKDNFSIVLTRQTDKFVSLWQRSDIANRMNADLFISIHANASRSRKPKVFEVYYLSSATDDSARARAAAENEAVFLENNSGDPQTGLNPTLWEMKLDEDRTESKELAKIICQTASKTLNVRNRGVKSARFYVLKGALMPAILIEVGFISNKEEEWKLRSASYRKKIASSIAEGILSYKKVYEETRGFTKNIN